MTPFSTSSYSCSPSSPPANGSSSNPFATLSSSSSSSGSGNDVFGVGGELFFGGFRPRLPATSTTTTTTTNGQQGQRTSLNALLSRFSSEESSMMVLRGPDGRPKSTVQILDEALALSRTGQVMATPSRAASTASASASRQSSGRSKRLQ